MHGLSRCAACGIFPDYGWKPHVLHWLVDSLPLPHQGSPGYIFIECVLLFQGLETVSKTKKPRLYGVYIRYTHTHTHTHTHSSIDKCMVIKKYRVMTGVVFQTQCWEGLSSSDAQQCLTLCDPMDCSMPGFPDHHQLEEFAQTHVH